MNDRASAVTHAHAPRVNYLQGKSGERKLGVSPDKTLVPVFMLLNGGSPTKQIYSLIILNPTPKPEAFEIPESCPKSSDIEVVHPLQLLSLAVPSLSGTDLIGEPLIKTMHEMS